MSTLEAMWLRAWIDGLHRVNHQPPVRPVEPRTPGGEGYVPPERTAPR